MKRTLLILLAVLPAVLFLGRKPLYNLYREVRFALEEQSPQALEIRDHAHSQGLSIGDYPLALIALYEGNPETREFVLDYPLRQAGTPELAGFSRDRVPLFLQWDPRWGYEDYGSSVLAVTGCGPTCLSMVHYYLTGDEAMHPAGVAAFAEKEGYYAPGYGSSWTLISEGASRLGLTATELPLVKKKMVDAVTAGKPVILALGAGDFTTSGHYIVLTEWTGEAFRVNDPNSRLRSEKLWTYEELEPQIRNIWAMEKR